MEDLPHRALQGLGFWDYRVQEPAGTLSNRAALHSEILLQDVRHLLMGAPKP